MNAPRPPSHKPQSTFLARDGWVWRSSHAPHFCWHTIHSRTCESLLASFRADASNTADWFHKRAGELADELEAAMAQAATQRKAAA